MIYAAFLGTIATVLTTTYSPWRHPPIPFLLLCLGAASAWTAAVTWVIPLDRPTAFGFTASLENYLQPIAVLLVTVFSTAKTSADERTLLFERLAKLYLALLLANGALAVASIFLDLNGLLARFVRPRDILAGASVSEWARVMGRFSGIFDTPAESGLSYSVGLMVWAYLYNTKSHRTGAFFAVPPALIISGLLSVSKVLLFLGIPIAFFYTRKQDSLRHVLRLRTIAIALATIWTGYFLAARWSGLDFLARLFAFRGLDVKSLVFLLSAGRYGGDTPTLATFARTLNSAPFTGYGFLPEETLDNGFLQFFAQGGLPALVAYVGVLSCLAWLGVMYSRMEKGRLLLALVALAVSASMGGPVLTINRFSIIWWVFVGLIIADLRGHHAESRPPSAPLYPAGLARGQ